MSCMERMPVFPFICDLISVAKLVDNFFVFNLIGGVRGSSSFEQYWPLMKVHLLKAINEETSKM
jgi:hypothetical protein